MAQTLHELLDELLRSAALTLEGQKTLRRYDYTINFDVLDGQSFHVEFIGGEADVQSGESEPKPILISHNIRGHEATLRDWFDGNVRYSDAIHDKKLYPQAAHTSKRHIDNWIVKLVRLGQGIPGLKDLY
jgi:hypothetical protein